VSGSLPKPLGLPVGETAHAQPPGPGLPEQAPSVYMTNDIPLILAQTLDEY